MHCLFPEGTVELVDVSEEIKNLKYTPGLSNWKVLYNRASTTVEIPCFYDSEVLYQTVRI